MLCLLQIGEYTGARYIPATIASFTAPFIVFAFFERGMLDKLVALFLCFFYLMAICFLIGSQSINDLTFNIIKLYVSTSLFICSYVLFKNVESYLFKKILIVSVFLSTIIILLESILRISNVNDVLSSFSRNFYLLKIDSPFFFDSNAAGIYIVLTSIVLVYFKDLFGRKYIPILSLYTICILFTFSRSSYVAFFALLLFDFFVHRKFHFKLLLLALLSFTTILYLSDIYDLLMSDGSGSTKFSIYFDLLPLMEKVDFLTLMFGMGITEGNYLYSYTPGAYSHALIPMILGHVGIFGLIVYFTLFFILVLIKRTSALYVIIPVFVLGFSYLHPFYETIFFVLGFVLSRRERLDNDYFK